MSRGKLVSRLHGLKFHEGLIPVVLQDTISKQVLGVTFNAPEDVSDAIRLGHVHARGRDGRKIGRDVAEWLGIPHDGMPEIYIDCDEDALLIRLRPHSLALQWQCKGDGQPGLPFISRFENTDQKLDFSNGLVPVIAQDVEDDNVLMLAWMSPDAMNRTLMTNLAHYYSRSRSKMWRKGEESGHVQEVQEGFVQGNHAAVLLRVRQVVAACHKGYRTCFYRWIINDSLKVIGTRVFDPKNVYGK